MKRSRLAAPGFAAAVVAAALLSMPAGAQPTKRATHRTTASIAQTTAASEVGQWEPPMAWPLVSVHAVLQPTGQVLMWDGFANGPNSQRLWNPATGGFTAVPNSRNIFCAGHTALYDGRTIVFGGHISPYDGLADTHLFDPRAASWTRGADMANRRWYPTGITLPDGRVFVASGDSITQDTTTLPITPLSIRSRTTPELYDARLNSWTSVASAVRDMPLYPFLFVLPDGRILDAGPEQQSRVLNVATGTWSTFAQSPIDGHSAVMYRPGKVLKSGKWSDPDFSNLTVHGRAAVLDATASAPAWRETAPMAFPRSYHNLVALPDGNVLAVGGGRTSEGTILENGIKPAELWNADTETWTTMAPMQMSRLYHSGALLLPDGRVLVVGGGALPNAATDQTSAEIYSPPYLFRGPRPTISSAPTLVQYGTGFSVETPDASRIAKVGLVRTGSVTHSFDMNQRYVPLQFTARAGALDLSAPLNANIAPPGYYMLFITDTNGVPSVASFVRLPAPFEQPPVPDAAPPAVSITAPANGATVSGNVTVSASATDDVGVAGVTFRVDGVGIGAEDVTAPYSVDWSTAGVVNGTHTLTAVARDTAGKETVSTAVTVTVSNIAAGGLVAAYSFEVNGGATVADVSGKGNVGAVSGATWSPVGRFDGALSFDAIDDWVTVADSPSLDLTNGVTLEAWVLPRLVGASWRTVVIKEQPGELVYALYAHSSAGLPNGIVFTGGAEHQADGTTPLPLNVWSHLSMTYDGTTVRFYVNGTLVGTAAAGGPMPNSADPLRIGGNAVWGEWFDGMIDEVRVYDRALSQAEIRADMTTPVAAPPAADTTPPTAPAVLSATGSREAVALSWSASTDAVGVARYNLHRSTQPGFAPSATNRIAQTTATSYDDVPIAPGTYYYRVTAQDAAGNVSAPSAEAGATATADQPPSAPGGISATGSLNAVDVSWSAATDDVGVARYNLHRSTEPGFAPSATNRVAQTTATSYRDAPIAPGTYYYRVTAEDTAGNVGAASAEASATAKADEPPSAPATLSAAGSIGAVSLSWSPASDDVGVARYNVHRSTASGFTPDATNRVAQTAATSYTDAPAAPGTYFYVVTAEDTAGNVGAPSAEATATAQADEPPSAPAVLSATGSLGAVDLSWSAASDDVGVARYNLHRSTSAGFTPSVENRIAQTAATAYRDAPLAPGTYFYVVTAEDTAGNVGAPSGEAGATAEADRPPTAPGVLSATGSLGAVDLSWTAASDDVGVVRYNVHRSASAGFTPSAANRIAQPTATAYRDAPLAPGTYFYVVTAEDTAGNVGAPSGEAGANALGDTTAPLVALTAPAAGTIRGTVTVAASASDDVGVASVQFTLDGVALGAADTTAPYSVSWDTRTASNGAHQLAAVARDAAGNAATAAAVAVTVDNGTDLVAAYAFNAAIGSTAADSSGNGNHGTISGAQWVAGRFGRGLHFDDAFVTVPDAASLDLDRGMTIEAWVDVQSNNSFRPVAVKEAPSGVAYGLYASTREPTVPDGPSAHVTIGGVESIARGATRINSDIWVHVAATYDGATLRIYVNGTLLATRLTTGLIGGSSGALRIGANLARGQWFRGVIDEVRIYRRALTPTEIRTDMNTPIAP